MVLKGIKVLELSGLLPVPYCGMVLADFGASVIRIDKIGYDTNIDVLGSGKKSISLNLKDKKAVDIIKALSKQSDVLIEPFRKGIMEKLGLGPDVLRKENPQLIYARLTGYGHQGSFSKNAGHDINYVALSGLLSLFGRYRENPFPPANILADIGGGGFSCAFGIILALLERTKSGKGQVVDCSMVEGSAYLGTWLYRVQNKLGIWDNERGKNLIDSGTHFYDVYKTKDGKYLSIGALEPQFYQELLKGLELSDEECPQFENYEEMKKVFTKKIAEKTRDEWCSIFDETDACVAPVLTREEAPNHPHNKERNTFIECEDGCTPKPHPTLSRTPGKTHGTKPLPKSGEHTKEILTSLGYSAKDISELESEGVIECFKTSKL